MPLVAVLMASVSAQQRAPENDSIRQSNLRADLYFLAGDSMRGRLTNTEENRTAADFIRMRFERMGLEPAGPDRFVLRALQPRDGHARRRQRARRPSTTTGRREHFAEGQEFYPERFSASGHVAGAGRVRRLRHQRAALVVRRLQRRGEGEDRRRAQPRAGRARSEQPVRRRHHVGMVHPVAEGPCGAAEGRAGGALRRRRAEPSRSRRTSRRPRAARWPEKPPRIPFYTLADWADRSTSRSPRSRRRSPPRSSRARARRSRTSRAPPRRRTGSRRSRSRARASRSRPRSTATSCRTETWSRRWKGATRR